MSANYVMMLIEPTGEFRAAFHTVGTTEWEALTISRGGAPEDRALAVRAELERAARELGATQPMGRC